MSTPQAFEHLFQRNLGFRLLLDHGRVGDVEISLESLRAEPPYLGRPLCQGAARDSEESLPFPYSRSLPTLPGGPNRNPPVAVIGALVNHGGFDEGDDCVFGVGAGARRGHGIGGC